MKEFIFASLPWILTGLAIAIVAAGYAKEKEEDKKEQERMQLIFMAVGMLFGTVVNSTRLLPYDHCTVISVCTLLGLAIGTGIKKEK